MFVQKANETNSHNCISIWSAADGWKCGGRPGATAWKPAAMAGPCHRCVALGLPWLDSGSVSPPKCCASRS